MVCIGLRGALQDLRQRRKRNTIGSFESVQSQDKLNVESQVMQRIGPWCYFLDTD